MKIENRLKHGLKAVAKWRIHVFFCMSADWVLKQKKKKILPNGIPKWVCLQLAFMLGFLSSQVWLCVRILKSREKVSHKRCDPPHLCVLKNMHFYVCVCTCALVHVKARRQPWVLPSEKPFSSLETDPSGLGSPIRLGRLATAPQRPFVSALLPSPALKAPLTPPHLTL